MKYYQKYQQFSEDKFRRMLGVNKKQFDQIYVLFSDYVNLNWTKRGRSSEFKLVDRLILTFRYLRDYPTFVVLGNEFGISESFANKIFNKVSQSLVKVLALPNLKDLENQFNSQNKTLQKVIIDISEQKTERPKKSKK
jgi:Helix-turn-helix of DDE superfamily endonuclease